MCKFAILHAVTIADETSLASKLLAEIGAVDRSRLAWGITSEPSKVADPKNSYAELSIYDHVARAASDLADRLEHGEHGLALHRLIISYEFTVDDDTDYETAIQQFMTSGQSQWEGANISWVCARKQNDGSQVRYLMGNEAAFEELIHELLLRPVDAPRQRTEWYRASTATIPLPMLQQTHKLVAQPTGG